MTWNYRVIREGSEPQKNGEVIDMYSIREVFYDGERPVSTAMGEMRPWGETLEELKDCLDRYVLALERPTLFWNGSEYIEEGD